MVSGIFAAGSAGSSGSGWVGGWSKETPDLQHQRGGADAGCSRGDAPHLGRPVRAGGAGPQPRRPAAVHAGCRWSSSSSSGPRWPTAPARPTRIVCWPSGPGRAPLAAAAQRRRRQLLILLAESDPYAAEFQEYFLKTEGFEVEVTLTDDAARESFADSSPAVVDRRAAHLRRRRAEPVPLLQAARRRPGRRRIGAGSPGPGDRGGRRRVPAEAARPAAARLYGQGPAAGRARSSPG